MKLGAHQSIAGNISNALDSVSKIGGNCLQIFSSSPRTWQKASLKDRDITEFVKKKKDLKIDPIVFHACYLINLADKGEVGGKSIEVLTHELSLAEKMEAIGSIVHTGSFRVKEDGVYNFQKVEKDDYKALLYNLGKVLENSPKNAALILENSGTHKIGTTIEELGKIITDISDDRLEICLDTCHLHASGIDITTQEKLEKFLDQFEKLIGLERLSVIHLNDSKDDNGSFRDRHENIGEGNVGIKVFENLLNHPAFKDKPFIIETPGFDKKGPDKRNLDILKNLVQ